MKLRQQPQRKDMKMAKVFLHTFIELEQELDFFELAINIAEEKRAPTKASMKAMKEMAVMVEVTAENLLLR